MLRMSLYKYLTSFQDNLELFIKKYLRHLRDSLPGTDYILNKQVLSGMSK